MKIKLVYCVLFLSFVGCSTPKTKKMTPLSDKEIKELGYQIKKEDTVFMKDGKLDILKLEKIASTSGSSEPPYYQYEDNIDNDIYIYISGDRESGYSKTLRKKGSDFKDVYGYFPSGDLKMKGNFYHNRFINAIQYWYNLEGHIEKYEDYDAPYDFSWKDVQKFLKEQNIKHEQITNIYRGELDGVHGWEIIYKPKEFLKTDNVKVLTLDAKTGKILSTEIRNVSRELD